MVKGNDAYDVFKQKAEEAGVPENENFLCLDQPVKAALLALYQGCVTQG